MHCKTVHLSQICGKNQMHLPKFVLYFEAVSQNPKTCHCDRGPSFNRMDISLLPTQPAIVNQTSMFELIKLKHWSLINWASSSSSSSPAKVLFISPGCVSPVKYWLYHGQPFFFTHGGINSVKWPTNVLKSGVFTRPVMAAPSCNRFLSLIFSNRIFRQSCCLWKPPEVGFVCNSFSDIIQGEHEARSWPVCVCVSSASSEWITLLGMNHIPFPPNTKQNVSQIWICLYIQDVVVGKRLLICLLQQQTPSTEHIKPLLVPLTARHIHLAGLNTELP